MLSLPTRERGLKFLTRRQTDCTIPVAPYAGAWIEIRASLNLPDVSASLPTRERGLK